MRILVLKVRNKIAECEKNKKLIMGYVIEPLTFR